MNVTEYPQAVTVHGISSEMGTVRMRSQPIGREYRNHISVGAKALGVLILRSERTSK